MGRDSDILSEDSKGRDIGDGGKAEKESPEKFYTDNPNWGAFA